MRASIVGRRSRGGGVFCLPSRREGVHAQRFYCFFSFFFLENASSFPFYRSRVTAATHTRTDIRPSSPCYYYHYRYYTRDVLFGKLYCIRITLANKQNLHISEKNITVRMRHIFLSTRVGPYGGLCVSIVRGHEKRIALFFFFLTIQSFGNSELVNKLYTRSALKTKRLYRMCSDRVLSNSRNASDGKMYNNERSRK